MAVPPLCEGEDWMPTPMFVVVGKVSYTNLDIDHNRAFNIDISQYGAALQQLICLHCFYPNMNSHFAKTPLPTVGKHVIVHGNLTGFAAGHCIIHVIDIALGPSTKLSGPSADMLPPVKLAKFDWKSSKGKGKHQRMEDSSKLEDENDDLQLAGLSSALGSQSVPFSGN